MIAFGYSILNIRKRSSKVVIILFFGLCGYVNPVPFSANLDIVRIAKSFMTVSTTTSTDFADRVSTLFTNNDYKPDIFQPLIEFLVSRFTTDYSIYFAVLGLVMGYSLMKVTRLFQETTFASHEIGFAFLFVFLPLVMIPPYRIAGFRQIVATLFFLYCAYQAVALSNRKYNYIAIITCLIHFSFLGFLPFFFLQKILKLRYSLYYIGIIAAFFLNDYTPSILETNSVELRGELRQRIAGYSSEEYIARIQGIKENRNIFIDNQVRWTAYFMFFSLLALHRRLVLADEGTQRIYALSLSTFIFLVLVNNMETTFVRFSILYILISCAIYLRMIGLNQLRMKAHYRSVFILVFLFNLLIMVRKSIEFTGIEVIYPNLAGYLIDADTTVLDLIQ